MPKDNWDFVKAEVLAAKNWNKLKTYVETLMNEKANIIEVEDIYSQILRLERDEKYTPRR